MPRIVDFLIATAALIVFAPLMAGIALAIRLTSAGPALFRQPRLGRGGRPFRIVKFRTMLHNAPPLRNPDGSAYTGADDPRVTAVGRFLRATSLDELPQLINVLCGDMSIVGPRPDLVDQLRYYSEQERRKLAVRPGLTGLAQISGRNGIPWARRKQLDLEYVDRRSARLDLSIVLLTIPYVLRRRGVNSGSSAG